MPDNIDKLLNTTEVAELLGVAPRTLEDWRYTGRGPRWTKLGSGRRAPVRYRVSDVEAFILESQNGW